MATDAQLIDAFSKGLQVKEQEVLELNRLLGDALHLLDFGNSLTNYEYLKGALIDKIKQQLKIIT